MSINNNIVIILPTAQFCNSKFRKRLNAAVLAALLFAPEVGAANSGGDADLPYINDYSGNSASNYTVTIDSDVTGSVFGHYETTGDVSNGTVNMTGGSTPSVYGGYTENGNATGNTVNISGGTADGVIGGYTVNGNATGNTVNISGGTVTYGVMGGYTVNGNATGNTVNISGGNVANVGGGAVDNGNATGNTVNLYGGNIGDTVVGGFISGSGSGDAYSGNTLNVYAKGLTVGGQVYNFQNWNFYLPSDITPNETILTAGGNVSLRNQNGSGDAKVGVAMMGGGSTLQVGDRVVLIHANHIDYGSYTYHTITGQQGVSAEYQFKVTDNRGSGDNELYAEVTVTPAPPTPPPPPAAPKKAAPAARATAQSKAVVEGRAAHGAKIAQQGNLVSQGAIISALNATRGERRATRAGGVTPFGAAEAGYERYNTGSHVELTGGSAVAGVGKRFGGEKLEALAGAFLEFGASHLKTFNDNAGFEQHGKGDASFIGGGILGRIGAASGLYTEASLRLGRMDADWNGNFLWAGRPWHDGYDADTPYYGAHAGLGCIMPLAESLNLDLYARYLWSRLEGDDMRLIRMRDPYTLDDVDSHRLRLGFTLTRSFSERLSGYAGGAWEHEFDGDAHALTYQILDVPSASFGGDTGVLDAGVVWQTGPFSTRAGLSGYLGTRRGVSGNVMFQYEF